MVAAHPGCVLSTGRMRENIPIIIYDDMLSLNVKRDVQRLDRSCFEKKTSDANSVFDMTKRFAAPIAL